MPFLRKIVCASVLLHCGCLAYRVRPGSESKYNSKVIPDKIIYSEIKDKLGPETLKEEEQQLVFERIERCFAPRADKNYTEISFRESIDDYMEKYVKKGLKKISRLFAYDMPHVWGKHWYTKYFPHHWMVGIIPDNEKGPMSHCLDFDYKAAEKSPPDEDPNGCLFFKRSFKPTQALVKCVNTAVSESPYWKAHKIIADARSSLHKVKMEFRVEGVDNFSIAAELKHAGWNDSPDMYLEEFISEATCEKHVDLGFGHIWKVQETCPKDSHLQKQLIDCGEEDGNGTKSTQVALCVRNHTGSDELWKERLLNRKISFAGDSCTEKIGLAHSVAVVRNGGSCSNIEKVGNATKSGAVAVILLTEKPFTGARYALPGGKKPAPTFLIDAEEGQLLSEKLFGLSKYDMETVLADLANADDKVKLDSYKPVPPEDVIVTNFAEEIRFFKEDGDLELTARASNLERTWEVLKYVTMAELKSNMTIVEAQKAIYVGIQTSMTQSQRSSLPAIDDETVDSIAQCYGFHGEGGEGESVSEDALVTHEASKCLPLMWDKVEVGGPPWPQAWEASGSFPSANMESLDALNVHPVCSRLSLSMNMQEMTQAPYPDPKEWGEQGFSPDKIKLSTAWDAMKKGNPQWLSSHSVDYCLNPKTAVCTSFGVCWALLTRRITKFVHPYCDESKRAYPEQDILDA